ncbi:MAG: NAD+ synthase, partial [Mycobacteriales bacterium]
IGARGRTGARNAAVLLHRGQVVATHNKFQLPTHGVFDEDRTFVPGDHISVVALGGDQTDSDASHRDPKLGMLVCADMWYENGPLAAYAHQEIDLLICPNASPFELGKDELRLAACRRAALHTGAVIAYVNLIGGQDELVFDGSSMVVHPDGRVLAHAPSYEEHLLVVNLDLPERTIEPSAAAVAPPAALRGRGAFGVTRARLTLRARPADAQPAPANTARLIRTEISREQHAWQAITLGLGDYVRKNGFDSVVLGVSGGIDSAVCAALACDALGASQVHGVALPSAFSSQRSYDDAADLAARTGLHYRLLPIHALMKTFGDELSLEGLAAQNLQARIRAVLLMGISNSEGQLLLSTGNKSECSVGYSTLYGDAAGAFAPLKDAYKTMVWQLARWRNAYAVQLGQTPPIPQSSITKPPSAELSLDQLDSDALPPYELLDAILRLYIEADQGRDEIVAAGYDPELVDRILAMVNAAEHKRRQAPPGPKLSTKAFGRDRQLPITNRFAG